MDTKSSIQLLEQEWEQPNGFFGQLRMQVFDEEAYQRLLHLLQRLSFDDLDAIDKRIVSLLWFIPTFMIWQGESLEKVGVNKIDYNNATEKVTSQLYRILGVP